MHKKKRQKGWQRAFVAGVVGVGVLTLSGVWAQTKSPHSEAKSAKATAFQSIRYRYDRAGRIAEAEYNEMIIRYRYDAGGNLVARIVQKK